MQTGGAQRVFVPAVTCHGCHGGRVNTSAAGQSRMKGSPSGISPYPSQHGSARRGRHGGRTAPFLTPQATRLARQQTRDTHAAGMWLAFTQGWLSGPQEY